MICSQNVSQPLPLAGWICYAEKTLGSYILPYISSVKSPQQAIGAAIKHHVVDKLGLKWVVVSAVDSAILKSIFIDKKNIYLPSKVLVMQLGGTVICLQKL
jgi:hypothetical protein